MRLVLLLALLLVPTLAQAGDEVQNLGAFRSWNAYAYTEQSKKVCFMATKPTKSLPTGAQRGDIYAQVTHRPADNSKGVFSIVIGYTFKANSEATLTIGNKKFQLMTQGDSAWARDEATDRAISAAIKGGNSMTVDGLSSRGTKTTDTYSLAGSSAAYEAIGKACGVN